MTREQLYGLCCRIAKGDQWALTELEQSLSQEAVRDEALEEAARVCYPIIRREQGWEEDNHVALLVEAQNAIRALKREPNAAAPGASDD